MDYMWGGRGGGTPSRSGFGTVDSVEYCSVVSTTLVGIVEVAKLEMSMTLMKAEGWFMHVREFFARLVDGLKPRRNLLLRLSTR